MINFYTGIADFTPVTINVTFEAGETMKNITVPIIPDVIIEENERFYVQLEGFEDQPNTIGKPDGGWATIIDDDCKLLISISYITITNSFSFHLLQWEFSMRTLWSEGMNQSVHWYLLLSLLRWLISHLPYKCVQ